MGSEIPPLLQVCRSVPHAISALTTPSPEFNVLCDRESDAILIRSNNRSSFIAEAAQIVLDCPVKTVMVPLNVTHTAIATETVHTRLCAPATQESKSNVTPSTDLRLMLSSLITFFAHTYKEVYGFEDGPPLHDALTVAFVSNPDLFKSRRYRVDIELHGRHTTGETILDLWDFRKCNDTWGTEGKNCLVLESLEVRKSMFSE